MTDDAQVKLLIQVQGALRSSRLVLNGVMTELFGAFVAPPVGSKLAVTLQEIKDAEESAQAAMMKLVTVVPPGQTKKR